MNFAKLNAVKIPEGNVVSISANGNVIWTATKITWDEVLASVNAGTYATDFRIGDCVPLDLGSEGLINMQIVAFDTDDLADGSGKAPITWIAKELLNSEHRINPEIVHNYGESTYIPMWKNNDAGEWISQNKGMNGETASATWTITAMEAGTVTVSYKVNCKTYGDTLTVIVNGETIASAIGGNVSWKDHSVVCAAGDTVTVEAIYKKDYIDDSGVEDVGYVKFSSTGAFEVAAEIGDIEIKNFIGYEEGTGSIGGWEKCEMRSYLKDTIKPLIPEVVRNSIKEVSKTQAAYDTDGNKYTQTTVDDVWIPSAEEVEKSGCLYSSIYPNDASRKKFMNGTIYHWFLRNSTGISKTRGIQKEGWGYAYFSHVSNGVALCFCT